MKTILLFFILIFAGLSLSSHTFAEVYLTRSVTDKNDNIIVIGYCLGNVKIAEEQFSITSPSAFILKLNSDGEMIWIKFINSSQLMIANAIDIDSEGNIYVVGNFSGVANFDSYSFTSQGTDFFILKYDSSGNIIWVKKGNGTGNETSTDIYLDDDDSVYVCGYGGAFTFDNLTTTGGGFVLKISETGNGLALYRILDRVYNIILDSDKNIIIGAGKYYGIPHNAYVGILAKLTNSGNIIWQHMPEPIQTIVYPTAEPNLNIIEARSRASVLYTTIQKFDPNGTSLISKTYDKAYSFDISRINNNNLLLQGFFTQNSQIGDSILNSNGAEDAFIALVDTGFSPIWIKYGGGLFKDELITSFILNDGTIFSIGNFIGTITFDNFQITGGTSIEDSWSAILKLDIDGNLIWFKKIGENYLEPSTENWFPLEKGNRWHFYGNSSHRNPLPPPPFYYYIIILRLTQIYDSTYINNKKYYRINGFFNFQDLTPIRYDFESQRLIILHNGQEYTFVDFSKVAGESYLQIQPNGSLIQVSATSGVSVAMGDTIPVKGFYRTANNVDGLYNFAQNIGLVNQEETNFSFSTPGIDLDIIEYILFEPDSIHVRHTNVPSINFEPVYFIPDTNRLIQQFEITHPYSIRSNSPYLTGFSYIQNAYLSSFYTNQTDTIFNNISNISPINEIDFSLNYQFDTTKYLQGYHLYYRIAAVDKGIIRDTFYSPQSGYYKLYWKDSTSLVTQYESQAFDYSLSQNYPNPFNPVSKINFSIPNRETVVLKVYDVLGAEIITLINQELDQGKYEVVFSGENFVSGIYIYQLRAGNFIDSKKMLLIK